MTLAEFNLSFFVLLESILNERLVQKLNIPMEKINWSVYLVNVKKKMLY